MSKPNIILIMSDQHKASMAGCYGDKLVKTPTIDSLAETGTVFDCAYTPSPLCAPARAALMTSQHVHKIEVWDNAAPLRSDWPTFAHSFRGAGYRTILCGKMHFVGADQMHGFEERWTQDIYPTGFNWTHRNRDHVYVPPRGTGQAIHRVHESHTGWTKDMDYDEEIAFRAIYGLRRIARLKERRPLFMTISFTGPHYPFAAPQSYWDLYKDDEIPLPTIPGNYQDREHNYIPWFREYAHLDRETVPDEVIIRARHATLARVTMIDDYLARIFATLEEENLRKNTIIIYTSDHGEMLGEHGLWFKCTGYEDSIRVPLIVSQPPSNKTPPKRVTQPVSLLDLGPTMCGLAQISQSYSPNSGIDHSKLLIGESKETTGKAIIEYYGDGTHRGWRVIRKGQYKLVYVPGFQPQLYNLATDPDEWNDIAHKPENNQILSELTEEILENWNPSKCDEQRYLSEERRLAILKSWGDNPPNWEQPSTPIPHPTMPEPE